MTSVLGRRVRDGVVRLGRAAAELLPHACACCCRAVPPGTPICPLCRARFPRVPAPRCRRCGEPAGQPLAGAGASLAPCEGCLDWPPCLGPVRSACLFSGSAEQAVKALKFGRWEAVASALAEGMIPTLREVLAVLGGGGRAVLVPVPLGRARLRERGFNQADRIAAALAMQSGLEARSLLLRGDGSSRQARTARGARGSNVAGQFRLIDPRPGAAGAVAAVIVDDVLTTGATLGACATALDEAGFHHIGAITFARALRPLESRAP